MTRFRPRTYFALFLLCLLLIGLAWIYLRGQHLPEGVPATPSAPASSQTSSRTASPTQGTTVPELALSRLDDTVEVLSDEIINDYNLPNLYAIRGTVWQTDWDTCMENWMARLEAAGSQEEFDRIVEGWTGSLKRLPAPEVVVALQGNSVKKRAVTDAEGKFLFMVPRGEYKLFAEKPARSSRTGAERMEVARGRVNLNRDTPSNLELSTDLASIRGRITDVDGRPVPGAKVTAIEDVYDPSSMHEPKTYSTVSGADGFYELQSLEPTDFYRAGRYLVTGSPNALSYVKIRVEADGFEQGKQNVARVPLVTEEGLYWGRRFFRALAPHYDEDLREKEDLSLPSIQGNTITGIDVLLTRVEH